MELGTERAWRPEGSLECYLCGAENSIDADYCYRCDGQLMKISPDFEEETELLIGVDEELIEDEADSPRFRRPRMRSLRSAEHRRLEDALGLNDEEEDEDGLYGTAVPTVEPTATPVIGTRAGAFDGSRLETAEISRRTVVLLGFLALLVGFFGYRVITHEPNTALPPDELPFTNPTLPSIPETTVTTIRPWSQNELIGKFAPTFMTVLLYECPDTGESNAWTSRYVTAGIAIDERNVIFSSEGFPNFDAVVILSGLGNSAIAYPNVHESGAEVASTFRSFSRTLDLVEEPNGEETFLISRDIASATTAVATAQDLGDDLFADIDSDETDEAEADEDGPENTQVAMGTIGVGATTLGDAVAVFIDESRYELDELSDMGRFEAELVDDPKIGNKSNPCRDASQIVDATPEPEPEEVDEPTLDDSAAAESADPNG